MYSAKNLSVCQFVLCRCVSKGMHMSSHCSRILAGTLFQFLEPNAVTEFQEEPLRVALNTRGGKILQILPFILERVRDRAIVTVEY